MTKTEEIEKLKTDLAERDSMIDDYKRMQQDGVWLSHSANQHYTELQNTTNRLMDKTDKLQDSNTELIKAIANLNGGVLKDLSETIVNITKRQ